MGTDWKDLTYKALNTFWQAAAVVFVFGDASTMKTTVMAAVAAGLAAVKTFVSEYLRSRVAS